MYKGLRTRAIKELMKRVSSTSRTNEDIERAAWLSVVRDQSLYRIGMNFDGFQSRHPQSEHYLGLEPLECTQEDVTNGIRLFGADDPITSRQREKMHTDTVQSSPSPSPLASLPASSMQPMPAPVATPVSQQHTQPMSFASLSSSPSSPVQLDRNRENAYHDGITEGRRSALAEISDEIAQRDAVHLVTLTEIANVRQKCTSEEAALDLRSVELKGEYTRINGLIEAMKIATAKQNEEKVQFKAKNEAFDVSEKKLQEAYIEFNIKIAEFNANMNTSVQEASDKLRAEQNEMNKKWTEIDKKQAQLSAFEAEIGFKINASESVVASLPIPSIPIGSPGLLTQFKTFILGDVTTSVPTASAVIAAQAVSVAGADPTTSGASTTSDDPTLRLPLRHHRDNEAHKRSTRHARDEKKKEKSMYKVLVIASLMASLRNTKLFRPIDGAMAGAIAESA